MVSPIRQAVADIQLLHGSIVLSGATLFCLFCKINGHVSTATGVYRQIAWIFVLAILIQNVTAAQVDVAIRVNLSHFAFIMFFLIVVHEVTPHFWIFNSGMRALATKSIDLKKLASVRILEICPYQTS